MGPARQHSGEPKSNRTHHAEGHYAEIQLFYRPKLEDALHCSGKCVAPARVPQRSQERHEASRSD